MNSTSSPMPAQATGPKVPVAIVGASGYSGEELVRLLLNHPLAELAAVTSRQQAGQTVAQVFPRFGSHPRARALRFSEPNAELLARQARVVFLALPHGVAAEYAVPLLKSGCQVIDLSADFRLRSAAVYRDFYAHEHPAPELLGTAVYGLPEVYREAIRGATLVASPGCYPTSILLPVIPLLRARVVRPTGIIANALSGVSGAGRKAELDYLFVECNESVRPYGVPRHRHLSEIEQELSVAAGEPVTIQFTPHLIPVNRGFSRRSISNRRVPSRGPGPGRRSRKPWAPRTDRPTLQSRSCDCSRGKALPDTKNVVGTNVLELAWRVDPRTGRLVVMSAEDNLVKGASGQAIQTFNILCGFPETAGLL
ncbi:MAG: N-acetyl-gamma-glutamyl-phosphate reductase [Verrucomicrobia bacterium]|nr:N-acetyl-gamma-glutamyl-phosphate reductase [Verrucomicrobiota bacterium]